jgi:hypothetical protein
MIRVHHDDADQFEDFDATSAAVTQSGALILTRVELRSVLNQATGRFEQAVSSGQLVTILAAGWRRVDNLEINTQEDDST